MKRIVSIILCYLVLVVFSPEWKQSANAQTAPVMFVLTVVAIGCVATIYVMQKYGTASTKVFVLEKGYLDGAWSPVATNALRMTIGDAFPAFRVYMNDSLATYRLRTIPWPTNWAPQVVIGRLENPIIQTP
jgi:hypothetical protein